MQLAVDINDIGKSQRYAKQPRCGLLRYHDDSSLEHTAVHNLSRS